MAGGAAIFDGDTADRLLDMLRQYEGAPQNARRLPRRGPLPPQGSSPFICRVTGAVDGHGFYPGVVTVMDPVTLAYADGAQAIHIVPANGETLVSGTRYGCKPIIANYQATGQPAYQVLQGAGGGGGGGGGVPEALASQIANKTITATAAATSVVGTVSGSMTLPANFLQNGTTIEYKTGGYWSDLATLSPGSATVTWKVGTATFAVTFVVPANVSAATPWWFEAQTTVQSGGGTGGAVLQSIVKLQMSSSLLFGYILATSTTDATIPNLCDLVWQWPTATANTSITSTGGLLESPSAGGGGGGGGTGTVTSVGLAAPAEFTVTGSPVTAAGTLTLAKATQAPNVIYAGPATGAAAAPTFRAIVAADLPGGGAGTGTVTSVGLTMPAEFTVGGSPVTGAGVLAVTKATEPANTFYAAPSGAAGVPTFRPLTTADLPAGVGTVLSVGLSLPSIFTVSGSPVTTSGTLTGSLASQSANTFFAAPSGAAGVPIFRTLTTADLPTGTGTVTNVSVVAANGVSGVVANPTTTPAITLTLGAVTPTSVAAVGTVSGSNLSGTNTGDQTITLTGDVTGSGVGSFAATISALAVTDAKVHDVSWSKITGAPTSYPPNGPAGGDLTGTYPNPTLASITTAAGPIGDGTHVPVVTIDAKGRVTALTSAPITGGGAGTVTSVGLTMPADFTVTGSPVTASGTLAATRVNQNANLVLAGPASGAAAAPAYRNLVAADLPVKTANVRLTLTQGNPVGPDVAGAPAATIYLEPYGGDLVALYDGTKVKGYTVPPSTISLAVPAVANQVYDVFLYDNAGTLTLEVTAWTNDTTRATGLTVQNGFLCKAATPTRRYVGTFRTVAAGQSADFYEKRFLWNYYNRKRRVLSHNTTAGNWTYATATWRQANGDTLNVVDFVIGVSEDPVDVWVMASATSTGAAAVGLGLDRTNAVDSQFNSEMGGANLSTIMARYFSVPPIGHHYLAWLEFVRAGTSTYYGNNSVAQVQCGLTGYIEA